MIDTIKAGCISDYVTVAKLLTGYANDETNTFSNEFTAFVCAWQSMHDLKPDGIIGAGTWTAITMNAPTIKAKARGNAVKALQILLAIDADGIWGAKTSAAVKAYQAAAGLTADGVCGSRTWDALICGTIEQTFAVFTQPVDYKQYDSRWGKKVYSRNGNKSQTMANSGCGPTACANVIATLVDESVNPWTLAELSMKWGTRTANSGTSWSFFKKVFEYYGNLSMFVQTSSITTAKACIDAGGYVVCSMGKGYWTNGGHFITMWKYEGGYIYCNDPASKTRKRQKETDFVKQRKQFFCFYK